VNGGRAPAIAGRLPSLARWRLFAKQQAQPVLRMALGAGVGIAEKVLGEPALTDVDRKKAFYFAATRRIFSDTDLLLAPSEFLRNRYISCGLPAGKIVFARYGLRHFARQPRRKTGDRVAFGYIGALHGHKGLDVLLAGFQGLAERADLHIFGSAFGSPISESYWRRINEERPAGVIFHGAYDNDRIGEILAGLDAVIVPSVWYENSPLTIQEAFIGGVPVVTSDRGGMAELVRDGVDGLLFKLGDSGDLRAKLGFLVDRPDVLEQLRASVPAVPDIEEQAADVRKRYEQLLNQ
jgi:glycosyltransferase involved in cell wall biosynthesis